MNSFEDKSGLKKKKGTGPNFLFFSAPSTVGKCVKFGGFTANTKWLWLFILLASITLYFILDSSCTRFSFSMQIKQEIPPVLL